ncbi:MAG: orotidine 5'-phosphate decarboxylase [Thermoplasmata archaeon]|nr:MAG: orotidine 5'-phosphate decarboxylase [Thermoplasmata archaeon]
MPANRPILQVALDLLDNHRALQIAEEAVEGGVDWLEAGTALIKSEGMNAIRELRHKFPDHTIVADMKTMDVGAFEVEMASKAGANIVIIMGVSDDGTIKEAIRAGQQYGVKIMVDLMSVSDKIGRAQQLQRFGADYLCIHVGIDEQMTGGNPAKELREVAQAVDIGIAAAGGLNSETVINAMEAGAGIIIVGGAITKASKVTDATKNILSAMDKFEPIKTDLYKKYGEEEIYSAFMKVSAPNIADAMHKKGAMVGIKPLREGYKMAGRAVTVRTADGDWAKPVEAIDRAQKGEIIVINSSSGHIAVWGELASWSCVTKGIGGVVIDGAVRDVDDIKKMDLPVFARHIAPNAGEPKGFGEIGAEITCGGICVKNGDWIVGDDSGIMVIPSERAREICNRALDVHERENRIREEIQRGSTLSKVLKLEKWEKQG